MIRQNIINISDMSDSSEMLVERPHKFVSIFAYILITLLAAFLILAFVGEIDVYVRAVGEVRPNDTTSVIRSSVSGRIAETFIVDGTTVQSGDTLFIVDVQEHLNTLEILERQYATASNEIENLILLRESIILGENLFNPNDATQMDYYFKYQKHVTDIETAIEQLSNANLDIERFFTDAHITQDNATRSRNLAVTELSALQSLLDSLERGENLVPHRHTAQHRQYIEYALNLDRYDNLISQKREAVNRMEMLYAVGGVSLNELDTARLELDSVILEQSSYVNEMQISVLQGITNLEWSLSDINAVIRSADSVLSLSGGGFSVELLREKHMLDALTGISEVVFSLQNNQSALQIDITSLRLVVEDAHVIAPIDGVVSMFGEMNVGDLIQAGTDIATVLPVSDGEHRVMLFVSNADISDIEVGQKINFRFAALPFADYGEMSGRITKISTDAISSEPGQSIFIVEAEMDGGSLYNRNGVEATIRVGMVCDARVITNTQSVIHWVLERLGFRNS